MNDKNHHPPTTGRFRAPDGIDLYFEDSGGDGPVLFYIYGLACSIAHWKYPLAYFGEDGHLGRQARKRRRQVWMDFRGHGRSDPPATNHPLSLGQIVDDIRALCGHRGITSATFLGQSMGGTVALALAAKAPALVQALVLLTSPGRDPAKGFPLRPASELLWRGLTNLGQRAPQVVRLANRASRQLLRRPLAFAIFREIIRQGGFNPNLAQTADITEYVERALDLDLQYFLDLAADMSRFDVARLAQPIRSPTLLIAGALDQVVPLWEVRRTATQIPSAELVVIPHGSHCPHFDDPLLVCERLEGFLDRHQL